MSTVSGTEVTRARMVTVTMMNDDDADDDDDEER